MTCRHDLHFGWLLCLAGLAVACSTRPCSGQVVTEEEEEPVQEVMLPGQQVLVVSDDQFDQWIFGSSRTARAGRSRLESLLVLQVEDVATMCALSPSQKQKLLLAGRGDIKRFLDQVEEKRKLLVHIKNDQNKFNESYQQILPLQAALRSGLFNEGSLYWKTVHRVLPETELARCKQVLCERNRFRYKAKVELVVAQLDQSVGLRDDQRRRLVELILNETETPTRFGQYDYYLVMYMAGQVSPARLQPLFDERQWLLLKRQLDQARGMERFLQNQGLLPQHAQADRGAAGVLRGLRAPGADPPCRTFPSKSLPNPNRSGKRRGSLPRVSRSHLSAEVQKP